MTFVTVVEWERKYGTGHVMCVDGDIIMIKEVGHMIVVYQRSCDNKARVEIGIKM